MVKKGCVLLCFLMMAGQCYAGDPFESSGLNSGFDTGPDTPFAEYIEKTRHMVERARVDLTDETREHIVRANTPFERSPGEGRIENGILLIHGLSDSPYQMNALADHFVSRGFLVRTLLLPGHGTRPGDLLDVTWQSWVEAAEYGANRLSRQVDHVFLGGFSTGGELSLLLALKRKDIKGLFLFSPVIKIDTPFAWFSTTFLAPRWLVKQEEKDFARYDSLTSNAVAQVYRLTKEVDRLVEEKKDLALPVFIALSEQDITVKSHETIELFNTRLLSSKSRMVVYTCDPKRFPVDFTGRIIVKDSRLPDQRILSFSHLSIITSPDDAHYGKNGDYIYSPHPWMKQSRKDVSQSEIYYGELMRRFKKNHYVQRLSYNPYFKELTREIDAFIDQAL